MMNFKMNDIIWLSHGGPGSGRYPKGSGQYNKRSIRKKIKTMNKYQVKDARLAYKQRSRQMVSDTYHDKAKESHNRFLETKGFFEKRKIRKQTSKFLKKQTKWDAKVSEIKYKREKNQEIVNKIKSSMNVPLKQVTSFAMVSYKGFPGTFGTYKKYKIDKKKLKR